MFFHDYNNRKAGIYKMPDISVLIIDDEPSILKAVSMTLKRNISLSPVQITAHLHLIS